MNEGVDQEKIILKAGLKYSFADFMNKPDYIKVMAIADGYVMMRRKGCIPFVMSEKEAKEYIKKKAK